MNSRRITAISAATILGAALLSGTAAAAGPSAELGQCAYFVATGEVTCFTTEVAAHKYAADVSARATAASRTSTLGVTSLWAGTLYDGTSGGGTAWHIYVPAGSGSAPVPSGANDRASSINVASGFTIKLYEHSGLNGDYGIYGAGLTSSLGGMNNKASSFIWY